MLPVPRQVAQFCNDYLARLDVSHEVIGSQCLVAEADVTHPESRLLGLDSSVGNVLAHTSHARHIF